MNGVIQWIISSAVLILAVLAIRAVFGNKLNMRLRYALWALVLVRLLVPFSIGSSPVSVQNLMPRQEERKASAEHITEPPAAESTHLTSAAPIGSVTQHPLTEKPTNELSPSPSQKTEAPQTAVPAVPESAKPVQTESAESAAPLVPGTTNSSNKNGPDAKKLRAAVWITGAAAVGLFFLAVNIRLALLLKRSRRRLEAPGCSLPVYITGAIDAPCLFGLLRPAIYVTQAIADDPVMLRHALAHETVHFRHGDHVFSLLRGVCIAIHWFDPLVWLAAVLSRRDSELACDESTIRTLGEKERADYGQTLIAMTCAGRTDSFAMATTMTGSKKSIQQRIKMITVKPKAKWFAIAAVLLAAAFAVCCTFTGKQAETPASDKQEAQLGIPTAEPPAEPTPEPQQIAYDSRDAEALRAFFELRDTYGCTNGEKLFADYDPDDPATWDTVSQDKQPGSELSWDPATGKLTSMQLSFSRTGGAWFFELEGTLELGGFDSLQRVELNGVVLYGLTVRDCPKLERLIQNLTVINGDIDLTLSRGAVVDVCAGTRIKLTVLPCDYEGTALDFTLTADTEYGGEQVGLLLRPDNGEAGCIFLVHKPAEGFYYTGWTDADGAVVEESLHLMPFAGLGSITGEYHFTAHSAPASMGNTDNVRILPGESSAVKQEDIAEAIGIVKEYFHEHFFGCTLVEIGYAGDAIVNANKPYSPYADADQLIYLTSTFMTGPDCPDDSLGRNAVYPDWTWILIKTGDGPWTLVDWGY